MNILGEHFCQVVSLSFFLSQQEVRINDLIREKENMATEIYKLKQELEKDSNTSQTKPVAAGNKSVGKEKEPQTEAEDCQRSTGTVGHLHDYHPGSPAILQRKLGMK